jgi:hypothetical protein
LVVHLVYYRLGQFRGQPVDRTDIVTVGTGTLVLTTMQLYFISAAKNFRIPYKKLVHAQTADDGLVIQRDGVSGKPQYLVGGDGWLLYNLVMNLAQQAAS